MTRRVLIAFSIAMAFASAPCLAQDDDGGDAPASTKYKFRLRKGQEFTGFMAEDTSVDVLVAGIPLKVPVPLIKQMSFNAQDPTRCRMSLSNGDSLTGQVMPSMLGVVADWGTLKINSQSVIGISQVAPPPRAPSPPSSTPAPTTTQPATGQVQPALPQIPDVSTDG